ncbi:uncharacterized protein [Palaemon carinicauda]|uniref:uncharacterized protein n=1 Tax=Palaemon carinicauda TaxID=392227 RepID=UPI0035B68AE7
MTVLPLVVTTLFLTTTAKGGTLWQSNRSLLNVRFSSVLNATPDLAGLLPSPDDIWSSEVERSSVVNTVTPSDPDETGSAIVSYLCSMNEVFPRPGSCRSFYHCEEAEQRPGVYTVRLAYCPAGTIFNKTASSCHFPTTESNWKECLMQGHWLPSHNTTAKHLQGSRWTVNRFEPFNPLKRVKRLDPITILTGILAASSVVSTAAQLFQGSGSGSENRGVGVHLRDIENKLTGVEAKLKSIGLSVQESNIENKIYSQMTNNLIESAIHKNQINSDLTRKLIDKGFLEQRISTAELQGMIIQMHAESESNFARIQVSFSELKEFMEQEIRNAKVVLQKGFERVPELIDLSKQETLVSQLLTATRGFNEHLDHLESLPEGNRKDEIERSGGYLEYLESTELPDILNEVIQQRYAIPSDSSNLSAVLTLDLLVDGLQVCTNVLSSVVSSNAYLASKALEKLQLEDFNTYMQRVHSAVERVKMVLGYGDRAGLIAKIKEVLSEAKQLPFVSEIRHFSELLSEKSTDIRKIEEDIEYLVTSNNKLTTPGTITGKPVFSGSSPSVPIGPWEAGKKVMYAIQLVSERGLSSVGEWSTPYTITDKACPTIKLPRAKRDEFRFLYRKFDRGNPELAAIVKDNTQTSVRDIHRDFLNAAGNPNEDVAIAEIRKLIEDPGLDIDTSLEYRMTPLHYAAKQGNVKVMDELIKKRANIRARAYENLQPLHFAALFGEKEGIEYLIDMGAYTNAKTSTLGLSPLHIAVANDHVDATESLLIKGAFINIKDNNGLTPLHMAVAGNGHVIDILIDNDDLDVNAVTNNQFTPLHYASLSYGKNVAEKLLQSDKIQVDAKTEAHLMPIHLAATSGNVDTIALLKQKGASLSAVDNYGSNALHYATFYGHNKAVLAIVAMEPSLKEAKNRAGDTVQAIAEQNKKPDILEIFTSDKEKLMKIYNDTFQEEASSQDCKTKDIGEQLLISKEKICEGIGSIDSYVNLVSSLIPLQVYYKNHQEYSKIFIDFDRDLKVAQTNAKLWRNGESIVKGISKTFELAKDFEPEFQRKYRINQRRIKEIIKEAKEQEEPIRIIRDEIEYIKGKIVKLLTKIESTSDPDFKAYLLDEHNSLHIRLEDKEKALGRNFTIIEKFKQTVAFLTFVKRDADKIRVQSQNTKRKVEEFRDKIIQDKTAFERHRNSTQLYLSDIESRNKTKNEELAKVMREREEHEKEIELERKQTTEMLEQIRRDQEILWEKRRELRKKNEGNHAMKLLGAILSPFIIGIPLLAIASAAEQKIINSIQDSVAENMEKIQLLLGENQVRNLEITRLGIKIAETYSTSEKIRQDLLSFILVNNDLKTLSNSINMILESIDRAIIGISLVKDIFDDVATKLQDMINTAAEAKTEAEMENVQYLHSADLSILLCNWNQVYYQVSSLHTCANSFLYLVLGKSQLTLTS